VTLFVSVLNNTRTAVRVALETEGGLPGEPFDVNDVTDDLFYCRAPQRFTTTNSVYVPRLARAFKSKLNNSRIAETLWCRYIYIIFLLQ